MSGEGLKKSDNSILKKDTSLKSQGGPLLIILLFTLISFLVDPILKCPKFNSGGKNLCNSESLLLIIFMHHFLVCFAYLGWLFNNPAILFLYLLMPPVIFLHWKTNDNMCIFTQKINDECGEDYKFHHIFDSLPSSIKYGVGGCGYLYGLYKFVKIM